MIFKTNSMKTLKLLMLLVTFTMYGQYAENFNSANSFAQPIYTGSTCSRVTPPTPSNNTGSSGGGAIRIQDYSGVSQQDQILLIKGINTLLTNSISFNINWEIPSSIGNQQLRPLIVEYSINSGSTWAQFTTYQTPVPNHVNATWSSAVITLPQLAKVTILYLRFRPVNNLGNTGSQVRNIYVDDIKTDNTLSNDDFSFKNFKIYPNPAKSRFTINLGNEFYTNYEIKIFNLIGQEVYSSKIVNSIFEINKTWSGEGIYFVKILNSFGELVIIRKIIMLN